MTQDPFRSPKQRLARAQEKIAELNVAVEAFVMSQPYARVIEIDPDGGAELHKIKMTASVPDNIIDLTMEIVEALRSALDQAGYACAILAGKSAPKSAYFPMADSAPELATVIKGRCKDLPSDIVTLFRSFMPYAGGNNALWGMNKIANTKHTALVPIGNASGGITVRRAVLSGGSIPAPRWDGTKNEMIFGRVDPGGVFEYDLNFSFYIAIGDGPALAGEPVLALLGHLAREVASIIAATETECGRIGLLRAT